MEEKNEGVVIKFSADMSDVKTQLDECVERAEKLNLLMGVNVDGIFCLVQHVKAYKVQSDKGEVSDFGKPCAECQKREMCDYDWLTKTDGLMRLCGNFISVVKVN